MKNRTRRTKLADVFFNLVTYILTAGVVGMVISKKFDLSQFLIWFSASALLLIFAYFITPTDKE